jgi:hypothetical protein
VEAGFACDKAPAIAAVIRPDIKDTLCTFEQVTTVSFELNTHNDTAYERYAVSLTTHPNSSVLKVDAVLITRD